MCVCDLLLCSSRLSWFLLAGSWAGVVDGQGLALLGQVTVRFDLCIEQRSGGWQSQNENSNLISNFATQSWSKQWGFTHYSRHHLRNPVLVKEGTGRLGDAWKILVIKQTPPNKGSLLVFCFYALCLVLVLLLGNWMSSLLPLETGELIMFRWYGVLNAAWVHGLYKDFFCDAVFCDFLAFDSKG